MHLAQVWSGVRAGRAPQLAETVLMLHWLLTWMQNRYRREDSIIMEAVSPRCLFAKTKTGILVNENTSHVQNG